MITRDPEFSIALISLGAAALFLWGYTIGWRQAAPLPLGWSRWFAWRGVMTEDQGWVRWRGVYARRIVDGYDYLWRVEDHKWIYRCELPSDAS